MLLPTKGSTSVVKTCFSVKIESAHSPKVSWGIVCLWENWNQPNKTSRRVGWRTTIILSSVIINIYRSVYWAMEGRQKNFKSAMMRLNVTPLFFLRARCAEEWLLSTPHDTISLHYLANGGSPAPELTAVYKLHFLNYKRITNVHGTKDASVVPGAKVRWPKGRAERGSLTHTLSPPF